MSFIFRANPGLYAMGTKAWLTVWLCLGLFLCVPSLSLPTPFPCLSLQCLLSEADPLCAKQALYLETTPSSRTYFGELWSPDSKEDKLVKDQLDHQGSGFRRG